MTDYILKTSGLKKEFNGFLAVDSVDLNIQKGHIHALIGPNGAGKTTCFNLLTKFLPVSGGSIFFQNEDITHLSAVAVARKGLVRSFQISAIFPHLTVLENVRMALVRKEGIAYSFWKSDKLLKRLDPVAIEILAKVSLETFSSHMAGELSYGRKRALEIATTLAMDPIMMLLDEPTQGMGHEDVEQVAQLIKQVSVGRTILMVEHNMKVISSISDRITVLARGSILAEGDYATVSSHPDVIDAYMGGSQPAREQSA